MSGMRRVLTQAEIEHKIEDLCDLLGESIDEYRDILEAAVTAEMTYKMKQYQTVIGFANSEIKMTVVEKNARADLHCSDELAAHKLADARRESAKEGLRSLHTRIDALRTLSANARAAT